MKEVLKRLVELQKIDLELQKLESTRGDLPQQVNHSEKRFKAAQEGNEQKKGLFLEYQKERNLLDMEIKGLKEKENKYKDQLYQVKNNREYDAVTMELESVRNSVRKAEDRILELMTLEEETAQFLQTYQENLAELETEYSKKKKELQGRMAETEKDEIYLKDQRDKIMRRIDQRNLSVYKRIAGAKNGLAVVPVARNACGGCFKSLPPQKILEIRNMESIHFCEVCGRILVWEDRNKEEGR